jgi:hypothetical protein
MALFTASLLVVIVVVVVVGAVAAHLLAHQPQPVTSTCAWPGAVNAITLNENPQLNVSNPDTAAAYWAMAFAVQAGLRVTLSGQYPDSRYMSFAVYDADGSLFTSHGVRSALVDDRIMPDPGSINPWQQHAPPGGQFTVTLRSDVAPNQVNTLPLAPPGAAAGATAVLYYRVYGLAHGAPDHVPLPTITLTQQGVSRQLPACPASSQDQFPTSYCAIPWVAKEAPACQSSASSPTLTTGKPVIVPFARQPIGAGGTPDDDIAYLAAKVVPPRSDAVIVIRAKAPTTPSGASPSPWPAPGTDLRYWSLCVDLARFPIPVVANPLPGGMVDYGCRFDHQVALDQDGYYSFVIGAEAQRAAIERIPGVTFLPLSAVDPTQAYKLNFRYMLANPTFAAAVQDVPEDGRSASASAVMGAYYPRVAFCSLAVLAASGPTACMTSAQPPSEHVNGSAPSGGLLGTCGARIVVAGVVSGAILVVVVGMILRYRRRKRSARVHV